MLIRVRSEIVLEQALKALEKIKALRVLKEAERVEAWGKLWGKMGFFEKVFSFVFLEERKLTAEEIVLKAKAEAGMYLRDQERALLVMAGMCGSAEFVELDIGDMEVLGVEKL